jgi:hypothetical protein
MGSALVTVWCSGYYLVSGNQTPNKTMILYSCVFLCSAMNYVCEYVYNCLLPHNYTDLIGRGAKRVMIFRMTLSGNLEIIHVMQLL